MKTKLCQEQLSLRQSQSECDALRREIYSLHSTENFKDQHV